jgi:hypothetical protein
LPEYAGVEHPTDENPKPIRRTRASSVFMTYAFLLKIRGCTDVSECNRGRYSVSKWKLGK